MWRHRNRWAFWSSIAIGVLGFFTCLTLLFFVDLHTPAEELPGEIVDVSGGMTGNKLLPRQLPVAGAEGYQVIVQPDGTSHLEGPDGKRILLAAGKPTNQLDEDAVFKRVADRLAKLPKPSSTSQLVVCETGVVDVPLDAVITYIGKDKVITHTANGTSVVYYTDGRVESRAPAPVSEKPAEPARDPGT